MRVPPNCPTAATRDGETANQDEAGRESIDLVAPYQVQAIH
jgi:hypothetical protein